MSLILQIETSTTACSVALSENGNLITVKEANEKNIHASHVTVFIHDVMQKAGKSMADLRAVAVSKGPGSYTGLRIGVSTAKGLCFALDIPLLAVNTLEAMASRLIRSADYHDALFCPMIDARRMEVYTAVYNSSGEEVLPVEAKIIDADSFADPLSTQKMVFFGDGASKCREYLEKSSNAIVLSDFVNSASDLTGLAYQKYLQNEFEDVAYFEPFYLKDFLVTQPKNK